MIFATVTGTITVFNLIWWSLRMLGLRPLLAAGTPGQGRRHTGAATARRHASATNCPSPLAWASASVATSVAATSASTVTPLATPTIEEPAVTDIRIIVGDQTFTAQLADNPTARDLEHQLL